MKKLLTFLGIFSIAVFFFGCDKEPTDPDTLASPTNFTLAVAGNDSLSLELSWDASIDTVDGYLVYFEGNVIDTVTATKSLTYTHIPTALGDYKVTAYKGSKESDPVTESSELVETVNAVGPVYWMAAPAATGPSGYGWDTDGSGDTYSMSSSTASTPKAMTDFYVDSVGFAKDTDKIISPDNLYTEWNETWFYDFGANVYDTLSVAPSWSGWHNYADAATLNNTIVLFVKDKHYLKMKIAEHNASGDHYIKFQYGFQKIAGFRRLK